MADFEIKLVDGAPVIYCKSTGQPYAPAAAASGGAAAATTRDKTRLTEESGARVEGAAASAHIGGPFAPAEDPAFLAARGVVFEELLAAQRERLARKPRVPIRVTLPDGKVVEGVAWETTPLAIATGISKGLAASVVVAKVAYSSRVGLEEADGVGVLSSDGMEEEMPAEGGGGGSGSAAAAKAELWDLVRPLEGDCTLELKKFEDKDGKMVFWHSSAHVLGECMECKFGAKLCIGPPTEEGFYYDAYMGTRTFVEGDIPVINAKSKQVCEAKQAFERVVMSKAQALRLFADNPFKVQLISTKIPEGGYTTAYRCGPLIDLCRGPHVPTTGAIKAMEVTKHSSSYWLGRTENDSLQRVYGISFPDAKLMKDYQRMVEEAKKRDHRLLGGKQELFFFHDLSPGSCFFMPHGARIFNRLTEHIRSEYRVRGFHEVVTPNMFNLDLWRISGHADHYLENMFTFQVEGADFGLKPMNCPGHCLMFDHRVRSYRELPLRLADFGVLHRNEFSGALTGLTRVRRFQQDDAHIFCRPDQIRAEVTAALEFMQAVYGVFGFSFELDLSTRPAKALGSLDVWRRAEAMMQEALEAFGRPWKLNPGDGAFYGPKIDIKVYDALGRRHQCATIQLDFQLPIRFNLRYKGRNVAEEEAAEAAEAAAEAAAAGGAGAAGAEAAAEGGEAAAAAAPAAAAAAAPAGGKKEKVVVDKAAAKAAARERGLAHAAAAAAAAAEKAAGGGSDAAAAGGEAPAEAAAAAAPAPAKAAKAADAPAPAAPASAASQMSAIVERARSGIDELPPGFERPVIIHRAILGSVERFTAVLIEHTGGKWPFWLSPRQVAIVPVALVYLPYANSVAAALHAEGYYVDVDASTNTLNKKVREAQVEQYNFILVLGAEEQAAGSVNVRTRANERLGTLPIAGFLDMCRKHMVEHTATV